MSGQNKIKQYVRASERLEDGYGAKGQNSERSLVRPLGFDTCALSLQRFVDPVLTPGGNVYDIVALVPWIAKHHTDPVSGEALSMKQITRLTFHKTSDGKYMCPITNKEFNDFSHIVAVKTSGHVYSYEAIQELNIKGNNWNCLMTGTPFTSKDIITIQDPAAPDRRNVNSFHYIKAGLDPTGKDEESNIRTDPSMRRVLSQMEQERNKAEKKKRDRDEEEPLPSVDGISVAPESKREGASFTMDGFVGKAKGDTIVQPKKTKKKGSVRLYLSCGVLDLTLHADLVPVACENFLTLCKRGYYKGVLFHRLIPGFMVQGGDPTGKGTGGESCWGKPFQDEFVKSLKHSKRGILSMANAGPHTNNSQFFILFAPKTHLDGKHTVFGEVSEATLPILDGIEKTPINVQDNRPLIDVTILDAAVLFDPFEHLEQEVLDEIKEAQKKEASSQRGEWFSNIAGAYSKPVPVKEGVGKYIQTASDATRDAQSQTTHIDFGNAVVTSASSSSSLGSSTKKKSGGGFGALF